PSPIAATSAISPAPKEPAMPTARCRGAVAPEHGRWHDNRWQPYVRHGRNPASRRRIRAQMSGCPLFSNRYRNGYTPMFRGKDGNPALQESAVEVGGVGGYKHYPVEQITDGEIVDTRVGGHLIGNPGHVGDLRSDRKAGIFEPLPGAENFVDLPV